MARLGHAHQPGRTGIAVPRDGETGDAACRQPAIVKVVALGDFDHGACGLAGGQNDDPPGGRRSRQVRRQALRRMRRRDGGVVQAFEEGRYMDQIRNEMAHRYTFDKDGQ